MRTRTIRQSVTFEASPREVYEMLMDSRKHSKITGDKAIISRKVGGKFTVGEYIQGGESGDGSERKDCSVVAWFRLVGGALLTSHFLTEGRGEWHTTHFHSDWSP